MTKKVLLLRTCSKGFEKLVNGEVQYKYRELKPYWESRLLNKDGNPKNFDEIHIKNGYRGGSPIIKFKFGGNLGIFEHEKKQCFKIKLGDLIEILNYNK